MWQSKIYASVYFHFVFIYDLFTSIFCSSYESSIFKEDVIIDIEIKRIIESKIQKNNDIIQNELKRYLTRHYRFQPLNINEISSKRFNESKKNYIRRVFSENPLNVLNRCVSVIQIFEFRKSIKLTPSNILYSSNDKKFFIREKIELDNVKYLTEIVHTEFSVNEIIQDMPRNKTIKTAFEIVGQNFFSHEVEIIGEIEFDEAVGNIIDSYELHIELQYYGLKYNNNLPIWMEYIIEGAIYQVANNWKLAVFNYFVAFDSFVQTVYNQIHKYYNANSIIKGIRDEIDIFIDDEIENMINELLEFEYDFVSDEDEEDEKWDVLYDSNKDEISKIRKSYYEGCDKFFQEESERIKLAYEYYKKTNKRLVKEKLKDIEIELGIDLNTSEFSGLSNLKSSIKHIEKTRNIIAHGNEVEIEIMGGEFYTIFSYIVSIIIQYDLEKNNWDELIIY